MARMTGLEPATSGVTGRGKAERNQAAFRNGRPISATKNQGVADRSWNGGALTPRRQLPFRSGMAQLTLGFLLSEDPRRFLQFACRACPHWTRKPIGEMVVAHGEQTTLNAIMAAAKCSRCGSKDVEVRVWKDTWSGPR